MTADHDHGVNDSYSAVTSVWIVDLIDSTGSPALPKIQTDPIFLAIIDAD